MFHVVESLFFCAFRDAAVCQQPGGGFPRLVGGPDDISRLCAVCQLQQRCTACHSDASGSPDSHRRCLSERHSSQYRLADTVYTVSTPYSSSYSCPDPISYHHHHSLRATAGDAQPTPSSAAASDGPGHPAAASADSPTCYPGIDWIFI